MLYCSEEFVTYLEGYGKEWISRVKSDMLVTYGCDRIRSDELAEHIDVIPRIINDDRYHNWVQKREQTVLGR